MNLKEKFNEMVAFDFSNLTLPQNENYDIIDCSSCDYGCECDSGCNW